MIEEVGGADEVGVVVVVVGKTEVLVRSAVVGRMIVSVGVVMVSEVDKLACPCSGRSRLADASAPLLLRDHC